MQITAKKWSNCTVLDLNGRLVIGVDLVELRNAVHEATGNNPMKIILNLANVTYVDVCGIDELVNTLKYIKHQGGRLLLTNLPRRVRILLDTAQLTKAFEVPNSEQSAITNFQPQVTQRQPYK